MGKTRIKFSVSSDNVTKGTRVCHFRKGDEGKGIVAYTMAFIEKLRKIGKRRTADRYATTIRSLKRYLGCEDITFERIDGEVIQGYEQWMLTRGLCRNTTSFYIRNLRSIYNHAVDDGAVVSCSPFKHVYTGIDKTVKRALPLEAVKRLKEVDLSKKPRMAFARDMFLFSFYTRGMSFIDMAQLTIGNLQGGVLCYRRQKTAQQLSIKWADLMQQIVTKYRKDDSPYLLPLACGRGATFQHRYKNTYKRIGKQLKKLGEMLQLPIPLTTYVARHSWASIAKSKNVEISTISEALGHDSEKTTRIYLSSLDTSQVDMANSLIINSI